MENYENYIGVIKPFKVTRAIRTKFNSIYAGESAIRKYMDEDGIDDYSPDKSISYGFLVTIKDPLLCIGMTNSTIDVFLTEDHFNSIFFRTTEDSKITESDVDRFTVKGQSIKIGEKTTVVADTTITGFDTVASSACVNPENYSQEIGESMAREEIKNKIWGHLGFVLQWANNGISLGNNKDKEVSKIRGWHSTAKLSYQKPLAVAVDNGFDNAMNGDECINGCVTGVLKNENQISEGALVDIVKAITGCK